MIHRYVGCIDETKDQFLHGYDHTMISYEKIEFRVSFFKDLPTMFIRQSQRQYINTQQ